MSPRNTPTCDDRLDLGIKVAIRLSLLSLALMCVPLTSGAQTKRGGGQLPPSASKYQPGTTADTPVSRHEAVDRAIGVCHLSENPYDPTSAVNSMSPALDVKNYFRNSERLTLAGAAKVSILQKPTHGAVEGDEEGDFAYYPEKGFLGNDRASLLLEIAGKTVRVDYFFRVMRQIPDQEGIDAYADNCPKKVRVWKISASQMLTQHHA